MSSSESLSAQFGKLAVDSSGIPCKKCKKLCVPCKCGRCDHCDYKNKVHNNGLGGIVPVDDMILVRKCGAKDEGEVRGYVSRSGTFVRQTK